MRRIKVLWELLRDTTKHWQADHAQRLGAALAYYAVLALPPILVILLYIASLFYNAHAASSQFSHAFNSVLGPKSGQFLQTLTASTQTHGKGPLATGVAVIALLFSASGFFLELQSALNSAWGVEQRSDAGLKAIILNRLVSFLVLAGIGLVLVAFLLATAGLAAVQKAMGNSIPGGPWVWRTVEFLVSFGVTTALFALIYKLLPDVKVRWRDVWIGAAVTALLFNLGKLLLGLYFAHSSIASAYGVAGSLILILVWIYYSAQIFLFGAEFTQVYANRFGRPILPTKQAAWKSEGESATEDVQEARQGKAAAARSPGKVEEPQPQPQPQPASRSHDADTGAPPEKEPRRKLLDEMAEHIHSWRGLVHHRNR